MASSPEDHELVVADDGSIPAEQTARLGLRPGAQLRIIAEQQPPRRGSIAGRFTSWPEVTWDDFERASDLAQSYLDRS